LRLSNKNVNIIDRQQLDKIGYIEAFLGVLVLMLMWLNVEKKKRAKEEGMKGSWSATKAVGKKKIKIKEK